mmetsp:Transcript_17497/g.55801  ORF Transcript_17497/g.55801 Transcript_17497/m.55801 type:complete len:318 (+) Transcript_17497:389-1342(+)
MLQAAFLGSNAERQFTIGVNVHHEPALVPSLGAKEFEHRRCGVAKSGNPFLNKPELSLLDPLGELSICFIILAGVVKENKPFHARRCGDQVDVRTRAGRRHGRVVPRYRAAQYHPRALVDQFEHGLQNPATNVVKEDIYAARARLSQACSESRAFVVGLVVDGVVDPQGVFEPGALCFPSGDPNDAAPKCVLGNLAHNAPGGASRRGHDDRLHWLRLANSKQAKVGREAGAAEHAKVGAGRERRAWLDLAKRRASSDALLAPAELDSAVHPIARLKGRAARHKNLANGGAAHDLPDLHRGEVRLGVSHPASHRRVQC